MGEILRGTITEISPSGVRIETKLPREIVHRRYEEVRVEYIDGRHISPVQLRKAWAIMTDISVWQGQIKEETYRDLRFDFTDRRTETLNKALFHLSEATVTDAREFINYLIDICIEFDVPLSRPLYETNDDIQHFVYSCLRAKKCCVCGQKADLHHVDRIGMGRDRTEIDHHGLPCLPLCRIHHGAAHDSGDKTFMAKYHLEPVLIDDEIIKLYKLGGKNDLQR